MTSWEQDPEAWKEEKKPWEDVDAWKLEDYEVGETEANRDPAVSRSLEVTVAVKPTVPVFLLEWSDNVPRQIEVEDRDALKLVCKIADLQKARTKEGELFQYSKSRNLWVRVPWEILA